MDSSSKGFSWSVFYARRRQVRSAHPSVYRLRVRKKLLDVIKDELSKGASVLDVGAHNKDLVQRVSKRYSDVICKTMDLDREMEHDYYSLDEVDREFDLIVLAEVIEHLELGDGIDLLKKLRHLLLPGGRIVVSTPNTFHPNR